MALDEEVSSELPLEFTFDELQDAFHDLIKEFRKVSLKNKNLKAKIEVLIKKKKKYFKIIIN